MARTLTIILLLTLVAFGGCNRYVDSKDPVRSLPEPTATPINVVAAVNDMAVTLTWEVADTAGITRYRVYSTTDTLNAFVLKDSTDQQQISVEDLALNMVHFFQVASVDEAGIEGNRSETVSVPVSQISISINNGAEYTNARNVSIRITANNLATGVTLSEDPALTGAVEETFASTKSFTLTPGDGTKTVYGQITWSQGLESGDVLSDEIILDSRVEIASVTFSPTGQSFSTGDTITFQLDAGETGGSAQVDVGGLPVTLFDDGFMPDGTADDGLFSGRLIVPSSLSVSNEAVVGTYTDPAGNQTSRDSEQNISIN